MQIGIMTGHFPRPTVEETLDAIVGHGIRCVQFGMNSAGWERMPESIDLDACEKVRIEIEARGITVAGLNGEFNMIDPDVSKREDGLRRLEVLASACKPLGTTVIATCTGSRNPESMWRSHPENNSEEAWQDLLVSMEQALKSVEKYGVTLAFEPEVNNVANTAQKSRRLLDEMKSPNLKIIMDGANIFHEGQLPRMTEILDEAFDLLGADVAFAHAKDLDHDGDAGHLPAGHGLLDYERYWRLLGGLDFDVPVILHGLKEEEVDGCVAFLKGLPTSL
ncbi:sugar phosphate isomerase/epimerase [Chloroflexi bacterium TSY]|nr:sugar phosphate isomerase/epimerase [Chloroflexi bacterium TSY]